MKIGVCGYITGKNADGTEFDLLEAAERVGFDYIEPPLATIVDLSDDVYWELRKRLLSSDLPCEACNVFFPGSLRLTGPNASRNRTRAYLEKAIARAAGLGVERIVFGSAGARNVPAGFAMERAWIQLVEMLRTAGDLATRYGITIVIEPLNRAESNILQTAAEGYTLAKLVDHANVRLLVDYYHMARDGEDCGIIRTAREWVQHAHFADPDGRAFPTVRKAHFANFFGALKDAGYSERISLEAGYQDFAKEAPVALAIMRELAA